MFSQRLLRQGLNESCVFLPATRGDHAEDQKDRFSRYGEIYCSQKVHCLWVLMTHIQHQLTTSPLHLWKLVPDYINKSFSTQKSSPVRLLPSAAKPKENTQPVHNGTIEHVVKLPVGTKSAQLGLNNEEEVVPVVAFKERRSLRTLTGLEEIQTHQRAGNWDNVWKCLQDQWTSFRIRQKAAKLGRMGCGSGRNP